MLRVFIGHDPRQPLAYHVLAHSIIARASVPVVIAPISSQFVACRNGLTPFTYARFFVPWLCNYKGFALFLDLDELVLADIDELFELAMTQLLTHVWVRQGPIKFEWASVMLFNCARCTILTPEMINDPKTENLHSIGWSDNIGNLPAEWNHLVGYDPPRDDAKLVHFTQGVPAWWWTEDCEYAQEWMKEAQAAVSMAPWEHLMGNSVHAKPVVDRLVKAGKLKYDAGKLVRAA